MCKFGGGALVLAMMIYTRSACSSGGALALRVIEDGGLCIGYEDRLGFWMF